GSAIHWGEPPKKDVFPHGLKYLWEKMGRPPFMCHSRWFSPRSHYVDEYDFYIQPPSWKSLNLPLFAAPKSQDFWDDLFKAAKQWGLSCYLQDWLSYQYDEIEPMKSDVNFANDWTLNMGRAAAKHGLTIQYCMAPSAFMMQAVKIPNVLQARASDDHNGMQPRRWYQPHFTQTSMLIHAIGFWPHKDTFFSSKKKAYFFYWEKRPEMECLTAVLSGGPVAPSDKIGNENKELLMKTCRSDGLLLKPDKPATPIDYMFREHEKYYITMTFNKKPSGLIWYYVHVMNLWPSRVKDRTINLGELEIEGKFIAYLYFKREIIYLDGPQQEIRLDLEPEGQELIVLCPELLNDIYLIGNPEKFVTCANKQITDVSIDVEKENIEILVENVENEPVPVLLACDKMPSDITGSKGKFNHDKESRKLSGYVSVSNDGTGRLVILYQRESSD
ncbi:MAG: hypothetical protein ACTSRA_21235, partial [Promethearchaeota archaeon]